MPVSRLLNTLALAALLLGGLTLGACASKPTVVAATALAPGATQALTLTAADGQVLHATWWAAAAPESKSESEHNSSPKSPLQVKGVVLLLHGTSLYGGFYYPWANFLQQHGYSVLAPDLRSWGQSQTQGAAGSVSDYDLHSSDLDGFLQQIHQLQPGKPVFLQGESMGGTIALYTQIRHHVAVDGVILNSPAMRITLFGAPEFLTHPFFWITALIGEKLPNVPAMRIPPESLLGSVIADPALRHRIKTDPLVTQTLPYGYMTGILNAATAVEAGLAEMKTPLLIIHGDQDTLVPRASSELIIARVSSQDKTLKTYPGLRHVSLLDTGHEQPWQDMLSWLDQHSQTAAKAAATAPAAATESAAESAP